MGSTAMYVDELDLLGAVATDPGSWLVEPGIFLPRRCSGHAIAGEILLTPSILPVQFNRFLCGRTRHQAVGGELVLQCLDSRSTLPWFHPGASGA